ncbi:hypothetical protein [Streptomyces ipomoeae]|uniref:Uncharacterized protein n=1 Tax=Streptomyces ipomoeae 91-03 TaxID=698759 RepID=L1L9A2_9ACTN|nr:hypothetical protein STRIP9103_05054 [Streptomyces ipomoeae 91-03]
MITPILVLVGILVLVIGGCVCVFLAARGNAPRWVRAVSTVTLTVGELTRIASRSSGRSGSSGQSGDDG